MVFEMELQKTEKKLKYPKAIFVIISNEFCERFSYYGMRTILALYIKNKLDFSDDTSTIIFHTFIMCVYAFPLFGAILADSLLGKFRTILYFSIVYSLGQLLLSASAVPTLGLPMREFSMLGLFLVAMGAGGIKPCVAALGGDQFTLPEQERYLAIFFSVFYFAINAGSFLSSFLTPELRNGIKCFGDQDCYSIAFFASAIPMVVGTVIFIVGKPLYRIKKLEGNVFLNVIRCISYAISRKSKATEDTKQEYWIDYAKDKYDSKLIHDIKEALQVLKLFIPLPFFWTLADQQGSRWIFQASRMDGEIGNFLVKADQMQVVHSLLIIILIPLFGTCVYPLMAKIRCLDTQLKRLITGGVLAAVAFILAGLVELKLETTYPVLPRNGTAQLRIFNPRNCYLPIIINNQSFVMKPFGIWEETSISVTGNGSIPYTADFSQCAEGKESKGFIISVEGQATSYALEPSTAYSYKDSVSKTRSGNPAIRVLTYNTLNPNITTKIELSGIDYVFQTNRTASNIAEITPIREFSPGTYRVLVNGEMIDSIVIKLGGVYTLQTYVTVNGTKIGLTTVTPPNSVHIICLLPQYIAITVAEVLFGVTGLEFAFTQAPATMKSILQAAWLMTIAFGNLIVVMIAEVKIFERQASEFFFFAALMAVDMVILAVMAKFYRYKNSNHDNTKCDDLNASLKEMDNQTDVEETVKLWNFDHKLELSN